MFQNPLLGKLCKEFAFEELPGASYLTWAIEIINESSGCTQTLVETATALGSLLGMLSHQPTTGYWSRID